MVAFSVSPHEVDKRMSVFLTLLLTTVGYTLIISSWLPVKPYLTFLDKYVLASFLVQFASIIETICVVRFRCRQIDDIDSDSSDGHYKR